MTYEGLPSPCSLEPRDFPRSLHREALPHLLSVRLSGRFPRRFADCLSRSIPSLHHGFKRITPASCFSISSESLGIDDDRRRIPFFVRTVSEQVCTHRGCLLRSYLHSSFSRSIDLRTSIIQTVKTYQNGEEPWYRDTGVASRRRGHSASSAVTLSLKTECDAVQSFVLRIARE